MIRGKCKVVSLRYAAGHVKRGDRYVNGGKKESGGGPSGLSQVQDIQEDVLDRNGTESGGDFGFFILRRVIRGGRGRRRGRAGGRTGAGRGLPFMEQAQLWSA